MNCEDVPLNEWDRLTGSELEAKELAIWESPDMIRAAMEALRPKPLIDGEGRPLA